MKISISRSIVLLAFLFPIGTIFSSIPGFGNIVNKLLYSVLILFLVAGIWKSVGIKKNIAIFMMLAIVYVYDCMITTWPLYNANEFYYLGTWVLYLIYASDHIEQLKTAVIEQLNVIRKLIVVWEVIILVSFFLSSSYIDGAFCSFSGSPHRMDSATIIIYAGILILYRWENYRKEDLLLAIIPTIAVALAGARTYLIVVGVVVAVIYYYSNINHTHRFYFTIIPFMVLAISLILSTSVMQERIAIMEKESAYFTSMGYNALTGITSGRSTFWLIDLQKYWESSIVNKILGNGFNFVRYVNSVYYTTAIWAHNDFINIICCNGLMGLILYFNAYFRLLKSIGPREVEKRNRLFLWASFHVICMFNAMFNMLYSYFTAALAVPILAIALFDRDYLPGRKASMTGVSGGNSDNE